MKGKLKKNSFLEGAMFAYIAILAAKVMGALYSIPFYSIIGDRGGVIYSCAYNIYSLFLEISTSGIPIAVSIVVSEYNARGMIRSKEKTYSLTLKFVCAVSLTCFLIMQIFAKSIGVYFLKDMTQGVTPEEIALGVRAISFCLLIVPFLSLKRGYLQGHKIMAEPSTSQVIEQLVRIAVVLAGSYTVIKLMGRDTVYGVCIALLGATAGAAAAYLYLRLKTKNSSEIFTLGGDANETEASNREIAKKVFSYCLTIVIVSVSTSIYNIVDMKMILSGLHNIGYTDMDTQEIASIASTWIPKICMIITALSMGITNSICPHLAQKRTDGRMEEVNVTLNQALSAFLLISMPLAAGLILLSSPVYTLFYGESVYGAGILKLATVVNIVGSMATIVGMSMQSIGKGKNVCVYNLIGIVANAALDLPIIYLMNRLGMNAYLGASVSSIIGQSVTLLMLLISLKKTYGFSFKKVFTSFARFVPGTAVLTVAVLVLLKVWPVMHAGRFLLLVQLGIYGVCGGGLYFLVSFFTGGISDVVGKEQINNILIKLHIKRG